MIPFILSANLLFHCEMLSFEFFQLVGDPRHNSTQLASCLSWGHLALNYSFFATVSSNQCGKSDLTSENTFVWGEDEEKNASDDSLVLVVLLGGKQQYFYVPFAIFFYVENNLEDGSV